MNHADVKQNLADYLEGDLSLEMRAGVDAHLDSCLECAEEVDEMQRTIRLLRTLPEPETPPMIAANVMRRIRAGETQPNWWGRIVRAFGGAAEPSFVLPASAIAVAALVARVLQDPGFLSRFYVSDGVDRAPFAVPGAPSSARSGLPASRFDSQAAGVDLNLRWPLGGSDDSRVGSGTARPAAVANLSVPVAQSSVDSRAGNGPRAALGPGVASGSVRYRFEFDTTTSRGAIRVSPSTTSPAPLATFVSRSGSTNTQRRSASGGRADWTRRVAQSTRGSSLLDTAESSGGEDPRDEWLSRGLDSPADFARFLASKNLAEHELWVTRLAQRAEERGLLDELVDSLRSSGDVSAAILSDDFAAHAETSVDSSSLR